MLFAGGRASRFRLLWRPRIQNRESYDPAAPRKHFWLPLRIIAHAPRAGGADTHHREPFHSSHSIIALLVEACLG
jgi:hypothetical protein